MAVPPGDGNLELEDGSIVSLGWIAEQSTRDEKFSYVYPSFEKRVQVICTRLKVKGVIDGTSLWDLSTLFFVVDRSKHIDIVDENNEPLVERDDSNLRLRRSAERKYEARFLREGYYGDLRGRMQGLLPPPSYMASEAKAALMGLWAHWHCRPR